MVDEDAKSEERAARGLAALGNRTRLRLFRVLVRAGPEGLNIGELQQIVGVPASTMAHHLATLARADLALQQRHGREVRCTANYEAMNGLVAFLTDQCCIGIQFQEDTDAA